ncbi:MAG TPA: carboxynorspermidine decarboxylase [Candidatus Amulumruptor caecigallinarius]|uniref:Carboxynorspermidine/carboxyspermidine decarboxylase n=1 Tax=Candidatus Amulumruptor caecigallinarius TaxID=2109911 RepID=A0A921E9F3_9BACT|nr:carboxynorspermidine decarboxylase [Candidatus Amulumruptor caecigallinarius]
MVYSSESEISTPFYIVYESRMRRNLSLISHVAEASGAKIIMAFKANAMWKTFPVVREYCRDFTASSLNELRLGCDELGGEAHSYCPAYTDDTIGEYLQRSTHITFNSLYQFDRFKELVAQSNASPGLRVNPQCSVIETDIYNPALPGSRFGVTAEVLRQAGGLPAGIEGMHFHALCESSSYDLEKVLEAFEADFGEWIDEVKWVNMGGGHLMTREGYDTAHLIEVIRSFRERHPGIHVILEPGSAFMWRTGDLLTSVVDIVDNQGIKTAIIDASFACHMPDCLEMPYKPAITGSMPVEVSLPTYRLGGNSCLSGDYMGDWSFARPLRIGDRLRLEDMNHYTTVKTNMFNGIQHPSMIFCDADGRCHELRRFTYEDYRSRMD